MQNSSKHSRQGGFILAEMLMAMIVLTIAAIAFLQTVQGAARQMQSVKNNAASYQLASTLMDTASSQTLYDKEPSEGEDNDTGLRWRVEVAPDKDRQSHGSEQPSIMVISVKVWKEGEQALELTSAKWGGRS